MMPRYGIPDPPFPKAVYRIPNPEWGISEGYEIFIDVVHGAPDPGRCSIVREMHGFYEEETKMYHISNNVGTVKHFLSTPLQSLKEFFLPLP
jgi:hypothetical protein